MTSPETLYYEAATPGAATPSRLALTAEAYGYDGLIIRSSPDDEPQPYPDVGIDLVSGIELDPSDRAQASGAIGHYRSQCDLLLVRGGETELNRYVLEEPRVDVLSAPFAGTGDLNHVLANTAAANDVAVELRLEPVLRDSGQRRISHIKQLRKAIELLTAAEAPYVVTAAATSHLELRSPRDLQSLASVLGLESVVEDPPGVLADGLSRWARITQRNRSRRSESFIEPGIYRGHPEEKHE